MQGLIWTLAGVAIVLAGGFGFALWTFRREERRIDKIEEERSK